MENNEVLDMAINLMPILEYLSNKGVADFQCTPFAKSENHIHLWADFFKKCFPDAVPNDKGFAEAEYKGMRFTGYIEEADKR